MKVCVDGVCGRVVPTRVLRRCLGEGGGGAGAFSWLGAEFRAPVRRRRGWVRVCTSPFQLDLGGRCACRRARGKRAQGRLGVRAVQDDGEHSPNRGRGGQRQWLRSWAFVWENGSPARDTGGRELGKRGRGRMASGARTFSSWFSSSSMPSPVSPDAPESPPAPDSPRWAEPTIPLRDDCSALVTASRARSRHIAAPLRWGVCGVCVTVWSARGSE